MILYWNGERTLSHRCDNKSSRTVASSLFLKSLIKKGKSQLIALYSSALCIPGVSKGPRTVNYPREKGSLTKGLSVTMTCMASSLSSSFLFLYVCIWKARGDSRLAAFALNAELHPNVFTKLKTDSDPPVANASKGLHANLNWNLFCWEICKVFHSHSGFFLLFFPPPFENTSWTEHPAGNRC